MRIRAALLLLGFVVITGGCARYEYDLLQPADLARHIGAKADESLLMDPLEYRLRTVDNRMVMRIYNPTDDFIQLRGDRSTVVDPQFQSHPLQNQTIAPGSFIKLILPPPLPRVERLGPSFGVGVGGGFGHLRHHHYPGHYYCSPFYDEPRYFTYYEPGDAVYWDWPGEGEARLRLVYDRGEDSFTHELTIARQKM